MAKILYVEDNEDNVYMLQRRLTRKGFDVGIAEQHAVIRTLPPVRWERG